VVGGGEPGKPVRDFQEIKSPKILGNLLSNSRKYYLFGRIIFLELPNTNLLDSTSRGEKK
jgi:hypothetical protein